MSAKEIKYDRNGKVISGIVTAIFVALLFMSFGTPEELEEELKAPPITISFGAEDLGANDDANPWAETETEPTEAVEEPVEEVESEPTPAEPTPSEPEPAAKEVVTDDAAPAVKPKKEEPKPKKEEPKKPKKPTEEAKPKKPKKPIAGSTFGKKDKKGTGDNKKPGPTGDPDSGGDSPTGKIGVTAGGDIGGGLSGRGVRARSLPSNNSGKFGTVVIKICVNPDGNVVSARYVQKGSTTSAGVLKSLAVNAAKKYKFQSNPNAPDKQCGTVTFKFRPG